MATTKSTGTGRKTTTTPKATAKTAASNRSTDASKEAAPAPAIGMTHADSMPIATPKASPRTRRLKPELPVEAPVSPQGKRRRRSALLLLVLLLIGLSFWLGRATYRAPAVPVDIQAAAPAPAALPKVATIPVPAARTEVAKPAATATPAPAAQTLTVSAPVTQAAPATNLLEVSVGTSMRGGLTMKFDHPVNWSVLGNDGKGSAEVDVLGVRDLGTFPRNLPLPPGVKVIHAGILEPDTLRLRFTLVPGVRALTAPADGPAPALNIFFRTAAEGSVLPALPQSLQTTGGCGTAATPETAKAMKLLQASLDKNPSYTEVRTVLATLVMCGGDGARAERLLADGPKGAGDPQLLLVAALRFARGDTDGAIQLLKSSAGAAKADNGYAELVADLQSATK